MVRHLAHEESKFIIDSAFGRDRRRPIASLWAELDVHRMTAELVPPVRVKASFLEKMGG